MLNAIYSVIRKNTERTVDNLVGTTKRIVKKYLQWVPVGSMLCSVGKSG